MATAMSNWATEKVPSDEKDGRQRKECVCTWAVRSTRGCVAKSLRDKYLQGSNVQGDRGRCAFHFGQWGYLKGDRTNIGSAAEHPVPRTCTCAHIARRKKSKQSLS